MDKETLFKEIRRSEVLLWVGAGFSRYAGYPPGGRTVELLHESLSHEQQQLLNPALPLPRYAEELVDLHNGRRHHLTRALQRLFTAEPTSTTHHERLAQLPFLDKIVTTNYDTLFERVYDSRLHKITRGRDLPLGEPGQVEFYKVHGDIHDPDSLVVTETDYRSFFKKQDDLLWKRLETLMAKYTVLFLGYSLEDQNVLALFEELLDKLGPMHRGAYLVAPGLKATVANRLRRRQVTYLDMTGEVLVEELMAATKAAVLSDLQQGLVSPDKTTRFLRGLGLQSTFSSTPQGLDIRSLARLDGPTRQTLHFSLPLDSPLARQLEALRRGRTSGPVQLTSSDSVRLQWEVEGLRLPPYLLQSVVLTTAPTLEKVVDVFFEEGPRYHGVLVRLYLRERELVFTATLAHTEVRLTNKLTRRGGTIHFHKQGQLTAESRGGVVATVAAGLETAALLQAIGAGKGLRAFEDGKLVWETAARPSLPGFVRNGQDMERLMQNLDLIERTFSVFFRSFTCSDAEALQIYQLAHMLRKEEYRWLPDGPVRIKVAGGPVSPEAQEIMRGQGDQYVIFFDDSGPREFTFMGWKFGLTATAKLLLRRPVLKRIGTSSDYQLTSREKQLATVTEAISECVVLQSGAPQTPQRAADEDAPG